MFPSIMVKNLTSPPFLITPHMDTPAAPTTAPEPTVAVADTPVPAATTPSSGGGGGAAAAAAPPRPASSGVLLFAGSVRRRVSKVD
jgi:hypothetical protein